MSKPVKIDEGFKKTMDAFIEKWQEKFGIKLTFVQATAILDQKIKLLGGIKA